MSYPPARAEDRIETVAGRLVADPYRWLEDRNSPETEEWSLAQRALTAGWFEQRSQRDSWRRLVMGLIPGHLGAPMVVGERRFFTRRARHQDHAVLVVADDSGERVLVDPNALSRDATTTLDHWSVSIEGDRVAYQLSVGGDEESSLWVIDTDTGTCLDGPIDRLRYSNVAWLPSGEEIFYVRRLDPTSLPEGEEAFHRRVFRHRVGTDTGDDVMVFGDGSAGEGAELTAYYGVTTAEDGRFVAATLSLGTAPRNEVWVASLDPSGDRSAKLDWRAVLAGTDAQAWPDLDAKGRLWLLTDLNAARRRLCVVDAAAPDPGPGAWREIVAEDPSAVLDDVVRAGDELVVLRSRHACAEVTVTDSQGRFARQIQLPGPGSASLTARRDEGPEVWITFGDFARPAAAYHLEVPSGILSGPILGEQADDVGTFAGTEVRSRQIAFSSADGTEVRMTVIAADDAREPGPRPTVLYGYGGFAVSMTPSYSSMILAWVAAGGVWAVANLRGGSEEGEDWHRGGMRQHKERVFEDFEAAADWLVDEGWTTAEELGILGGSNGGLLVGAALTRSPERYRAVVCSAPLLDMVRYERFGLGATWSDEYGSASDPVEVAWLLGYSPYHRVVGGTRYPAVLFTVFEGDSRVDTLHARKMAAALQAAAAAPLEQRPVLLRAELGVGHGARSITRGVDLAADELGFLGDQLGLSPHE